MNNSFEQLGRIIERILKDSGLDKQVKESQAINFWKEIAGEEISNFTEAFKVADGKLFIRVKNPSWRNELIMLKPQIKSKLNKRIGASTIKDIIFL